MHLSCERILERLRDAGLSHIEDKIRARLRPAIRLRTRPVAPDDLPMGASRIGGVPDVPPAFSWPHVNSKAMAFIAQLNLFEMAQLDVEKLLPTSGWLCFFYEADTQVWGFDPADRGNWRVAHFDCDVRDLSRASAREARKATRSNLCAVSYQQEITLPSPEQLETEGIIKFLSPERDAYPPDDLIDELCPEEVPHHLVLGNPNVIQSDIRENCQLACNGVYYGDPSCRDHPRYEELKHGVLDWILLLQIDTDEEDLGWMWGDAGRIYYCIRKQDLAARNFEHVWLVLECY